MATARWVAQTESFAPRCRRANRPRAAAPRLDGSVFVGHRSLVFGKTNESELERRDDTLAFPSEEQRDPGSACSTPANADCRVGRGAGAQARLLLLRRLSGKPLRPPVHQCPVGHRHAERPSAVKLVGTHPRERGRAPLISHRSAQVPFARLCPTASRKGAVLAHRLARRSLLSWTNLSSRCNPTPAEAALLLWQAAGVSTHAGYARRWDGQRAWHGARRKPRPA
jgi:hypothetical protein